VATVRLVLRDEGGRVTPEPAAPAVAQVAPPPAVLARPFLDKGRKVDGFVCGLPHRHERARTPAPTGNPLSNMAIVAGFNAIRSQVGGCFALYQVPGLAMVNVTIGKSGRVSKAYVTGKFAGTPTGACVEAAVKAARFPASDGLSAPYPFQLR
jgi:hypothetical protein